MRSRWLELYICIALVIGIIAVYGQVWNHAFISHYDDDQYIVRNPWVQGGLTFKGIARAFTTTEASNWHPLTWLSHMTDCQLFGLNPGGHHLTSLLFHIVNTLLLFIVFRMMTGDMWPSAFVAALFAFHPLHVESVAWVAERKDVLSAFFWLLTMWSYVGYTRRPGIVTYLPVFIFFALGLMSKPMVVTLPFVLMLLDWWPLGRLRWGDDKSQWFRLIGEKVPLLVLSAVSSVITFLAQRGGGAVSSLEMIPLQARAANAVVSYVGYLVKMIWPQKLAFLYPHPGMPPLWQIVGAIFVFLAVSFFVVREFRGHPYLAVGWLWYLGTLVPVIGLVQVGTQSMADRYTYLPLVGIFIIVGWGVPAFLDRWRYSRAVLFTAAVSGLAALMVVTWVQAGYWKDNISLFQRALDVTTNNCVAHNNLGTILNERGDKKQAIVHYREVLRIKPDFVEGHVNLANVLAVQGETKEAIAHYHDALRIKPDNPKIHYNLAVVLLDEGDMNGALKHFREVLRLDPRDTNARNNLGGIAAMRGDFKGAADHYVEALILDPGNPGVRANLSKILKEAGDPALASRSYGEILRVAPQDEDLHMYFGVILSRLGDVEGAVAQFGEAARIKPGDARARYNLGLAYSKQGMMKAAAQEFRASLEIDSGNHKARYNLALALYAAGDYASAIECFEEVMHREPALEPRASYDIARAHAREGRVSESVQWLKRAVDAGFDDWDRIKTDPDLVNIRENEQYREMTKGK